MKTIWKYTIARVEELIDKGFNGDLLEVWVPMRGVPIEAGFQDYLGFVCWATVDTEEAEKARRFWIVGTGRSIDAMYADNKGGGLLLNKVVRHLNTVVHGNGEVYHVFCEVF